MERFIFGFNGLTYDQSQPVRFLEGAREGRDRRAAEWQIRTALGSRTEPRGYHAIQANSGNPIADALLRLGKSAWWISCDVYRSETVDLRELTGVVATSSANRNSSRAHAY
jgi:hypothetical protein